MGQAEWARDLARRLLAGPLPRRWAHTRGVGVRAESLAAVFGAETDLLAAAAWLHDIGYAPDLAVTGFHPLDGARYLRDVEHAEQSVCRLVAHHTCAVIEADERGIADELECEFPPEREDLTQALIYCDMTTGPDGQEMTAEQRLAEIQDRYGPDHIVTHSIRQAAPILIAAVHATGRRINDRAAEP